MNRINTSPEALRNFAREIQNFIDGQEELIGRLNSRYSEIGSDWNDVHYQRFGDSISNIIEEVKSVIPECENTIQYLEQKAQLLDDYNS